MGQLRCKRCGGAGQTTNGFMRGKQRYRCKACGLNLTDTPPRGMPLQLKVTAILLYVSGLSMNRTAKLLGVSTLGRVHAFGDGLDRAVRQGPRPETRAGRPCLGGRVG
jgi:transposase